MSISRLQYLSSEFRLFKWGGELASPSPGMSGRKRIKLIKASDRRMIRLAPDGSEHRRRIIMEITDEKFRQIWRQSNVPVIVRQEQPMPVLIHLPDSDKSEWWIPEGKRTTLSWNAQLECWETPRSWFNEMIQLSLKRYGDVQVVQLYRKIRKCVPACWNATGDDCECSCGGGNHGTRQPLAKGKTASDIFVFKSGSTEYACRRIKVPVPAQPVQGQARAAN